MKRSSSNLVNVACWVVAICSLTSTQANVVFAQQYQTNPTQNQVIQQPAAQNVPQVGGGINQVQPVGQPVVQAPGTNQPPVAPFPPLPPEQVQYLDQVLNFWTQETEKIERYRCDFQRWTFDGAVYNNAPQHSQYAKGIVRYMKPDQGLFKVESLYFNQAKAGQAPQFNAVQGRFGEWWICDGKTLHEFDRNQEQVTRYALPPDMQGVAIISSPLPFLFGVKAQDAKDRYWLRPLAPPADADGKPRQDIIVIEAFPKYLSDAQNYSRVKIYLDRQQFLPLSLEIFLPGWSEQRDVREVFEFANREKNWNWIDRIQDAITFKNQFIDVQPPKGWKIIDAEQPPVQGGQLQAQQPQGNPQR